VAFLWRKDHPAISIVHNRVEEISKVSIAKLDNELPHIGAGEQLAQPSAARYK
jgi:hypothetical protein